MQNGIKVQSRVFYVGFALPDYGELVIDCEKLSNADIIRRFRDKKD